MTWVSSGGLGISINASSMLMSASLGSNPVGTVNSGAVSPASNYNALTAAGSGNINFSGSSSNSSYFSPSIASISDLTSLALINAASGNYVQNTLLTYRTASYFKAAQIPGLHEIGTNVSVDG
jgi:hypothetical protein